MKRHWGLFNGGVSDRVRKDASLSLRQGFFAMDQSGSRRKRAWSESWSWSSKRKVGAMEDEVIEMA